jgi:hypothetical protein
MFNKAIGSLGPDICVLDLLSIIEEERRIV